MKELISSIMKLIHLIWILVLCFIGSTLLLVGNFPSKTKHSSTAANTTIVSKSTPAIVPKAKIWQAPDTSAIPKSAEGDLIRYGRDLIAHTAVYLGPKGKVKTISNGMNCQNCHLEAGTVPYGNNYGAVASKYPILRNRSGIVEGFEKRVNDCIERSLNGEKLEEDSKEMKAMVAYLKWVGKDIAKGEAPPGFGLIALEPLDRPADPVKGRIIYENHCVVCHQNNGEGKMAENGLEWVYPPLYGKNSYNVGAGLYRISTFARYIKANMPFETTYENPVLTDEEAWDVAAYVNAMSRPQKDLSSDWPDISKKPFDHPFGPYADNFSENQHKFGPFKPIIAGNK